MIEAFLDGDTGVPEREQRQYDEGNEPAQVLLEGQPGGPQVTGGLPAAPGVCLRSP